MPFSKEGEPIIASNQAHSWILIVVFSQIVDTGMMKRVLSNNYEIWCRGRSFLWLKRRHIPFDPITNILTTGSLESQYSKVCATTTRERTHANYAVTTILILTVMDGSLVGEMKRIIIIYEVLNKNIFIIRIMMPKMMIFEKMFHDERIQDLQNVNKTHI